MFDIWVGRYLAKNKEIEIIFVYKINQTQEIWPWSPQGRGTNSPIALYFWSRSHNFKVGKGNHGGTQVIQVFSMYLTTGSGDYSAVLLC